ncbi:MAG: folylpolyglutamate synthase/dihydrofolate synthase family protein [Rikenellaceae bacterium]
MNYTQTTEYLFSAMPSFQNVGGSAYKPGLERIEAFCKLLGDPHKSYPVIHVAGTNGKGSTSHMLASVLQSAGYRVGLFTSPHLRDFRERMRIGADMISKEDVVDFVASHRDEMEQLNLSFFEMTAAMAFDFFARSNVDIAVVETGLGGRLDATNIIDPELSIITNIGIDHTQYLGTTLPEIAAEKAGIIKCARAVVVGERVEEYRSVMEQKAADMGSDLVYATDSRAVTGVEYRADRQLVTLNCRGEERVYSLDLMGAYQTHNLMTLLSAIDVINAKEEIKIEISQEAIDRGLNSVMVSTSLCGRWQTISESPKIICDTGHNSHGLREVTRQLAMQQYSKLYCVLGFARDKNLREILPLFPKDCHFIFTRAKVERAFTTAEIAEVARDLGLEFNLVDGVVEALAFARSSAKEATDLIFIGGSNFVIAEV